MHYVGNNKPTNETMWKPQVVGFKAIFGIFWHIWKFLVQLASGHIYNFSSLKYKDPMLPKSEMQGFCESRNLAIKAEIPIFAPYWESSRQSEKIQIFWLTLETGWENLFPFVI